MGLASTINSGQSERRLCLHEVLWTRILRTQLKTILQNKPQYLICDTRETLSVAGKINENACLEKVVFILNV